MYRKGHENDDQWGQLTVRRWAVPPDTFDKLHIFGQMSAAGQLLLCRCEPLPISSMIVHFAVQDPWSLTEQLLRTDGSICWWEPSADHRISCLSAVCTSWRIILIPDPDMHDTMAMVFSRGKYSALTSLQSRSAVTDPKWTNSLKHCSEC